MAEGLKLRLDYDDYAAIPSDGKRYELLNGELFVTPAPSPLHQRVSKRLQRQLEAYFEEPGKGEVFNAPVDVILSFHDVVQPDLVVVTNAGQVSGRAIEGPATLLVEVLSPASARTDRTAKAQRYASLGVPHYWIVDPTSHAIECYRAEAGTFILVAEARENASLDHPDFPGLQIQLAKLWT